MSESYITITDDRTRKEYEEALRMIILKIKQAPPPLGDEQMEPAPYSSLLSEACRLLLLFAVKGSTVSITISDLDFLDKLKMKVP